MGYRSEVTIAIVREKDSNVFTDAFPDLREELNGIVYYQWNHVKWYYEMFPYESVKKIMDYLDEVDEEDDTQYGYYRIGEEIDDIESKGSPYEMGITLIQTVKW